MNKSDFKLVIGTVPFFRKPNAAEWDFSKERFYIKKILKENDYSVESFKHDDEIIDYANDLLNKSNYVNSNSLFFGNNFKEYILRKTFGEILTWPRDNWVYFNKNIIYRNREHIFSLGEGGMSNYSLNSNDYFFGSSNLIDCPELNNFVKNNKNTKIFTFPSGIDEKNNGIFHIDSYSFYIDEIKTLFVDTTFFKNHPIVKNVKSVFNSIDENVDIIYFNESEKISYSLFPANTLVLPVNNKKEMVFLNSKASNLIRILQDENIDFVKLDIENYVDKYNNQIGTPSIRCATNILPKNTSSKEIIKDLITNYITNIEQQNNRKIILSKIKQ